MIKKSKKGESLTNKLLKEAKKAKKNSKKSENNLESEGLYRYYSQGSLHTITSMYFFFNFFIGKRSKILTKKENLLKL